MTNNIPTNPSPATCPICHKHCPMNDLACDRGLEYAKTGSAEPSTSTTCRRHAHPTLPEFATIDEKLFFNMRNCAHILRHNSDSKGGQGRILSILRQREHLTQRELMDIVDVSSASLSEVLGKIEAHGFIQRNRRDDDKRNVDIQLTEAGVRETDQAEQNRKDSYTDLFSGLSAEEKASLVGP